VPKFESSNDVRAERERVNENYEGGLPEYLTEYFDQEELKDLNKEVYAEKYKIPKKERIEFIVDQNNEFWEEHEFALKKLSKRTTTPIFEESPRASERVEQERDLTPEEVYVLVNLCEYDLYLFAIRYFPHFLTQKSSRLHKWLYQTFSRELGGKKKRYRGMKLAVAAPRGNAKSSIVSNILILWCIVYKKFYSNGF